MHSVEDLQAIIASQQKTIALQAQTIATLTELLAGEDEPTATTGQYLGSRG